MLPNYTCYITLLPVIASHLTMMLQNQYTESNFHRHKLIPNFRLVKIGYHNYMLSNLEPDEKAETSSKEENLHPSFLDQPQHRRPYRCICLALVQIQQSQASPELF